MDLSGGNSGRTLLNLTKPRVWQPWQAYADLKYNELKPEIEAGYAVLLEKWKEGHADGEKKPVRFAYQNSFLKARLEAESDEMKTKVEEHRTKIVQISPDELNRQYQM
jgi:hypothetical protein